ncbi:MAG: hypothetical protein M3Z01_00235 [Thermoproteota archaeon]|nr:hypothetical protein [Thermoproteota archaeon]
MSIIHNGDIKSPELQASIVRPILSYCVKRVSFNFLASAIQKIMPLSFSNLKRYLFYLIEYELISYDAQEQKFTIEDGGLGLLDMIDSEKSEEKMDINDITITFEFKKYVKRPPW